MEHIGPSTRDASVNILSRHSLEDLTRFWHTTQDLDLEYDLHNQHFNAMEPLMEYHVDGIDEACDDAQQSNLKRLVATAIHDLQLSIIAHEDNLPSK